MRRGRTWHWTRMRPFLAQFSESVWSGHLPSWADFITTTPVFRFSVHTGLIIAHDVKGDLTARWPGRFILLAPHDERSWGWAIGRDIVGTVLARELSTLLVAAAGNDPQWAEGA